MTIYEQIENLIKCAKLEISKIFDDEIASGGLNLDRGINISKYDTELKVAIITVLSLGVFEPDDATFIVPNTHQCIVKYMEFYNGLINHDNFSIRVSSMAYSVPIPIIY